MRLPRLRRRRSAAKSRIPPRRARRRSAARSRVVDRRIHRRSAPRLRIPPAAKDATSTAAHAPAAALHALPPRARLAAVGMAVTLAVLGGLYFFWLRDSSLVRVEH